MGFFSNRSARWVIGACIGLAAVLALPSLFCGFVSDDVIQIAQLEGWDAPRGHAWDLFNFGAGGDETRRMIERGPLPWWAAPDYRVHFFRPLSSLVIALEHALFGQLAPAYHLSSLLMQAGLVAAVAALFRRTLPKLWGLSLLLFAIDDAHAEAVGWIAANNSMLALTMAVLALIAYLRYREENWKPGMVWAVVAATVGALAGEAGIAALAYILSYQLVGSRQGGRVVDRLLASWPFAFAVVPHMVAYALGQYGSRGHLSYLDPTGSLPAFLSSIVQRVLALIGNLVLGSPVALWWKSQAFRITFIGIGIAALVLVRQWSRVAAERFADDERRHLRWLWLGSLLAIVPSAAGPIGMTRVLVVATLGVAPVLALLLHDGWARLRDRGASIVHRAAAGAGMALIGLPNVVFSVLLFLGGTSSLIYISMYTSRMSSETERVVSEIPGASSEPPRVLVVSSDDPATLIYVPYLRRQHPKWRAFWTFAPLARSETLRRLDARTLELSTSERFFAGFADTAVSGGRIPPLGTSVRLDGADVSVTGEKDGYPNRIALRFDTPHDLERLKLIAWRDREVHPVALPEVGQMVVMEETQPMWLFR